MATIETIVLSVGVVLAKAFSSSMAETLGVFLPIALGCEALVQRVRGKIQWHPFPPIAAVSLRMDRERWRKQAIGLWMAQLAIGVLALVVAIYLFIVSPIPQDGTPPLPNPTLTQSAWLIVLAFLIAASAIVGLTRYSVAAKLKSDD